MDIKQRTIQKMVHHKLEAVRQLASKALGREIPSQTGIVITSAKERRIEDFMGEVTVTKIPFKEYRIAHAGFDFLISLCELDGVIYVYQDEQGHYLYLEGTMTKASES